MFQSYLAWHLPISSYQLHCCWLEVGWHPPLSTRPTHSTGLGCGVTFLYISNLSYLPSDIFFDLVFCIWSKNSNAGNLFQHTCSNLILPDINLFHLILRVALVGGWITPPSPQGPPIPHREAVLWPLPWHGRRGGLSEPGTYQVTMCV